jgi:hypothetical protein
MSHNNLHNYFRLNFNLVHHHKWSLSEIENMTPWERDFYVDLIHEQAKEKEESQISEEFAQMLGG